MMRRLTCLLFVTTLVMLSACLSATPSPIDARPAAPETSTIGETIAPSDKPTQPAPPPVGSTLTPVPTLGAATTWLEPEANRSVIFELPAASGGQDLYRLSPRGEPPVKLANIQQSLLYASASGKFLAVYTSPPEGVYRDTLSLLSLADLSLKPVAQETWVSSMAWSPGGEWLAYSQRKSDEAPRQIVIYNPTTEESRPVFEVGGGGIWIVEGWVHQGQKILLSHLSGGGLLFDQAVLVDIATDQAETIYTDSEKMTNWIRPAPGGEIALLSQLEKIGEPTSKLLQLDLNNGDLTTLGEQGNPNMLITSEFVWSPDHHRVAFTITNATQKGERGIYKVVVLDVTNNQISTVAEIADPPLLIRPLAWVSENVLIVNNLGGEAFSQVLYSIRADGSNPQRLSEGRFLTVGP